MHICTESKRKSCNIDPKFEINSLTREETELTREETELTREESTQRKVKESKLKEIKDDDKQQRPETFFQNNFGLITPMIAQEIGYWIELGIEEALILQLMKEAVSNGVRKWKYVNTAIKNQFDRNISTLKDYLIAEKERERAKTQTMQEKRPQRQILTLETVLAECGLTLEEYEKNIREA
jgi:DnaD/phage-associated family protein